ncbi:MAG TPA: SDR family oxidoreductase [Vicinamibacterales bacterium]
MSLLLNTPQDSPAALPPDWLSGRVALVTGGSRGIGAAIADALAAAGADVVVTYERSADRARRVVETIQAKGRRGDAIAADGRDPAALDRAVRHVVQTYGGLDIVVCNAGIARQGPIDTFALEDFDDVMAVNLRSAFIVVRSAAPVMREGGRIILIGSNLAERVTERGFAAYSASKAGLIGLARGLARDLGPRAITVNVVQPGSTDTDMNPADGPYAEPQRALMAIPRFGDPRDVASLVTWLAGPAARSVTGATFTIDGGANA